MMFVAVLLGSCAKNGEYKNCDLQINPEAYQIELDPNAEVCEVTYYENDERIWSKTTVNGVTIGEAKWGECLYEATYNLDSDTIYFYVSNDENETVYEKSTSEDGSRVDFTVTFYERKDISYYKRVYVNGKLNLNYSGCRKQLDENGNFSIAAQEVWCNCPNEDLDKFIEDLMNSCK